MEISNVFFLLAVETTGIQKYIFNSNRLQENVGASQLVASISGEWAFDAIRKTANDHNIDNKDRILDKPIESSTVDVEVLYSGGGNFVALFRTQDAAKKFAGNLSRRVLTDAPVLNLSIHSVAFTWGADVFGEKLEQVFGEMKERRSAQPNVMALSGLGITVMCQSTAMPAVGKDEKDKNPVSPEVLAKLEAAKDANERLKRDLPAGEDHVYPLDFDDLGRTRGEASLIAVVHADGDGIGKRIEAIGDKYLQPSQARTHITELRNFSDDLNGYAQTALRKTVDYLWQLARDSEDVADMFGRRTLPFRPLVFGGDDVTFVCDGRIGLALTLKYLEEFQAASGLTACAGVAIVKSHYPFARAYELAEELCQSAKAYRRTFDAAGCYLDWHFTAGGIYGDIGEIRRREYRVSTGSLTLRPVSAFGSDLRSWATIAAGLKAFQGEEWQEKRNKTKALREKLRGGRPVVQEFETLYGQELPSINGFEHGWSANGYSGYFDAIELMDLYLTLLQEENVDEHHAAS